MATMKRKRIKVRLQGVCMLDFQATIESIRGKFRTWEALYPDHTKLRIEEDGWNYHDSDYALFGDILETEKEFEKRKAKAAKERARRKVQKEKAEAKKEEKDRKDYERLKKKYESEVSDEG